jgi:hypothetical protein
MRGRGLVVGVVLLATACTTEDPPVQDGPPDPAPVLGASHVLLPMPERHQDVWEWSGDPAEPAVKVSGSS